MYAHLLFLCWPLPHIAIDYVSKSQPIFFFSSLLSLAQALSTYLISCFNCVTVMFLYLSTVSMYWIFGNIIITFLNALRNELSEVLMISGKHWYMIYQSMHARSYFCFLKLTLTPPIEQNKLTKSSDF